VVASVVALDPPLRTGELWPLIPNTQAMLTAFAGSEPWRLRFAEAALGIRLDGVEDRDYRWVLDGLAAPAWVVVAGEPLMPVRKGLTRMPSLVGEAEREALRRAPGVRLIEAPGAGHDLPGEAGSLVLGVLREALAAYWPLPSAPSPR
jgi:pimeloyl-ACP methyl ester carboxylesterase